MTRSAQLSAALVALALGLLACATRTVSEVPFSVAPRPPEGMALVYVFRSDARAATTSVPMIRINGRPVLELDAAEYTAVHLASGRHTVTTDADSLPAISPARPFVFFVKSRQVAALALAFTGAPPAQSEYALETRAPLPRPGDPRARARLIGLTT